MSSSHIPLASKVRRAGGELNARPALRQSPISVRTTDWIEAVGDAWPWPPDRASIDRRDVFTVAEETRKGRRGTDELLVAACAWGFGTRARYGPWRTQRMLRTPHAAAKLDRVVTLLTTDLKTAYQSMWPNGPNHLERLGPAFWTKLFYFAGYGLSDPGPQPLILDANVARGLRRVTGETWPTGGWRSETYIKYLEYAELQAREQGIEPDQIELQLFEQGKAHRAA